MQKEEMLKFMMVVTLLLSAPVMDAAPHVSEVPDLLQVSLTRGDQKPPDPWTDGPDIRDMTATGSLAKLLMAGSVTTYSNEHEKTEEALHRLNKITNSPRSLDKSRHVKFASETSDSEEVEKKAPAPNHFDNHFDVMARDDPGTKEHATTEGNSLYKRLKLTPATTDANKQRKPVLATNRSKMSLSTSSTDRQEKLMKMLSALEELHRSMNSTLSSRITIVTRGTNNGRGSGKKSKMVVTEGNPKSTTVSSVASSGTSQRTSTDQADSKILNGKTFKKSLPSTPKKSNKRAGEENTGSVPDFSLVPPGEEELL